MDDVARIAGGVPGVERDGAAWKLDGRLLAWPWLERVHPKRPRLPNPDVLVVRVADEARKFELVATEPEIFFTEPHYDGYAAVLVRLPVVPIERLE
ncbi:MAG TPA: hypothetical protein VFI15_04165, partial [Candidatus Limnocylindrales bacterium]|nr:hypothetical protein [Candidatus Limnocylindrales bacterium]